ncbi:serine/threonine protein kinase [Archangium minus]|uniref:Serine/threonine protein kinase n=1 Tax=Archangium minus TaxID=83450 RepID=A0ABY9WLJ4_9BACT|nr:serine/threonine protein kinase [Archangium minus]
MSIFDIHFPRLTARDILLSHGGIDYYRLKTLVAGPGERKVYLCLPRTGFKEGPLVEIAVLDSDASLTNHRRMNEEADLLKRMSHPSIPHVHGVFKQNGRRYLVMDYVFGFSLNMIGHYACMRKRPMSERFIVHVAREVAKVLDYVHSLKDAEGKPLGIIHRGIDPYSILVAYDGRIILTKFVSAYSRVAGRETTNPYILRGEVDFAAPEYLCAPSLRIVVDGRADLFSLGLVIVELATGQQPYATDEMEKAAAQLPPNLFEDKLNAAWLTEVQCWTTVEDLSRRASAIRPEYVEQLTQHLSAPVQKVFLRLLRREPSERYASAAELLADLDECARQWDTPYGPVEAMEELLQAREEAETRGPAEFRPSDDDERRAGDVYFLMDH